MADREGQQLGSYQIIRLLDRGGFAEVYLGEHIHLQTQAAIKILQTRQAKMAYLPFSVKRRSLRACVIRILSRCWSLVWMAVSPIW